MNEIEIRIVKLEGIRMLSSHGFGKEPEGIAWEKLLTFATKKGLYDEAAPPPTYGFNNPNPSEGSPNYGYELWLPVGPEVEAEGDLRLIDFPGGLYAVATFKGLSNIGDVWGRLVKWRENSKYKTGHHQWLEELVTSTDIPMEEFIFNLYLPIIE